MSGRETIAKLSPAIRIIHGDADRVTSHLGTQRLFARLPHTDKEFEIYPGYEHGKFDRTMETMLR